MDVKETAEEVNKLRQQLHESEDNVRRSSVALQQIKEENEELSAQMERLIKENCCKLESLEQERYSLQLKLSQQMKMTGSVEEELENVKISLARQHKAVTDKMETDHAAKVERFCQEIKSLQFDLEQCQGSESEFALEREKLQSLVNRLQQDLEAQARARCESSAEDVSEMSRELNALRKEKLSMSKELTEANSKIDQLEKSQMKLKIQLQQQMAETEEKQCQMTSYYNTIELLREEIQELKVELDLAHLEANTMKKKGNSLFAEVEDRRIEVEKLLISMKVQNDSLKKQLEITKQNLHSVKLKLATLLQTFSVQADKNYMDHLSSQLSQASGEVRFLTAKLHESETREKTLRDEMLTLKETSGGSDAHHVKYLQFLLEKKELRLVEVEKELQTQRLLMLAESDNLSKCGKKLYSAEQQIETFRALSIKQSLKIEELKLKYEPDSVVKGTVRKVWVEKIPLTSSESSTTSTDTCVEQKTQPPEETGSHNPLGKENDVQSVTPITEPLVGQAASGEFKDQRKDGKSDDQASSGKRDHLVSSDGSLPEQKICSETFLKSILIPSEGRRSANNAVQSNENLVPKIPKKVTLSEYVKKVDAATNEIHCSRMEDKTDLDSTTANQPQPREKQSKVIPIRADNDCKTQ